jgi:hypothetical protein
VPGALKRVQLILQTFKDTLGTGVEPGKSYADMVMAAVWADDIKPFVVRSSVVNDN